MKIGKYTVYAPFLAGCDESDLYQQLRSGDRIWLFDRIAPSDENNEMADLMMGTIFPDRCFRMLRFNENEKSIRIIEFKGHHLSEQQALAWRTAHPVMYPQKAQQNSQEQK
ncbi:toxin-activating lysine-acyltransferase [Morganella morganii]|uniref:toxin-activating lysine-acyltransferase n=1 Tax=Morganella morganii TaxID=582 RepID=UPI0034D62E51